MGEFIKAAGGRVNSGSRLLSVGLCLGLAACVGVNPPEVAEVEKSAEPARPGFYVDHPQGAIAPAGFISIKAGMTQGEVLRILDPLYEVEHAAAAWPGNPLVDYITYVDGGEEKYGEVFYDGNQVEGIRYGYREYQVIH